MLCLRPCVCVSFSLPAFGDRKHTFLFATLIIIILPTSYQVVTHLPAKGTKGPKRDSSRSSAKGEALYTKESP